jgi:hypothetical protein
MARAWLPSFKFYWKAINWKKRLLLVKDADSTLTPPKSILFVIQLGVGCAILSLMIWACHLFKVCQYHIIAGNVSSCKSHDISHQVCISWFFRGALPSVRIGWRLHRFRHSSMQIEFWFYSTTSLKNSVRMFVESVMMKLLSEIEISCLCFICFLVDCKFSWFFERSDPCSWIHVRMHI